MHQSSSGEQAQDNDPMMAGADGGQDADGRPQNQAGLLSDSESDDDYFEEEKIQGAPPIEEEKVQGAPRVEEEMFEH